MLEKNTVSINRFGSYDVCISTLDEGSILLLKDVHLSAQLHSSVCAADV